MYTKEQVNQIINEYNNLSQFIGKLAEEIAIIRGENTARWQFYDFEIESTTPQLSKPDLEDYYEDRNGHWYHHATGSIFEDDLVAYKNECNDYSKKIINAYFDLGHENTTIIFPASYLWSSNFLELELKSLAEKKAEEEAKYLRNAAERLAQQEKQDRAEFERLLTKYGKK